MKRHPLAMLMAAGIAATALIANVAHATDAPKAKAKPAAKAKAQAKPAEAPAAPLSAEQLSTAERVLTGKSSCEFDQSVDVATTDKKGYFNVSYKGKSYLMVPENTTTGAVRLEDKKNGVMWLQIANKSMLMNSKIGQRMIDNCVHPSQKA